MTRSSKHPRRALFTGVAVTFALLFAAASALGEAAPSESVAVKVPGKVNPLKAWSEIAIASRSHYGLASQAAVKVRCSLRQPVAANAQELYHRTRLETERDILSDNDL